MKERPSDPGLTHFGASHRIPTAPDIIHRVSGVARTLSARWEREAFFAFGSRGVAIAKDRTMDRTYNHLGVEERLYQQWVASGAFTPAVPAGGRSEVEPFTIVIPPPNVTGALHHGSAMFVTIQDIMSRWRRMQGRRTLWLPGTDHAGIATQNVVERALAREGKTRFDLGRDSF